MDINLVNHFINFIALNLGASYAFIRIINFDQKVKISQKIVFIIANIIEISIEYLIKNYISSFYRIALVIIIYGGILALLTKVKYSFSLLITTISFSFSYLVSLVSILITSFIFMFVYYPNSSYYTLHTITVVFSAILSFGIIYMFFRIRRFKRGFPFLIKYNNNEYFNIFILFISVIVLFMYFICAEYTQTPIQILILGYVFFAIIMFAII